MRLFWVGVVTLLSCEFSNSLDGVASGEARMRRITINPDRVFADLTEFPVWIVIDDAGGLGVNAASDGSDIYFTKPDGMPLEYERVAWSKATGHLEAWVKVDVLDAMPTLFDVRYGDPPAARAPDAGKVFSNGFAAVWHMDAIGSTSEVADARNMVTGAATNGPMPATGKLGGAIKLDGINDEITFANPIKGPMSSTISAWVSIAAPAQGFSSIVTLGNPMMNQSRFLHTRYDVGLGTGFYGNDTKTTVNVNTGQFTLVHWVYDSAAKESLLYRDGMLVPGSPQPVAGMINTQGNGGHIGTAPPNWGPGGTVPNPINGLVDEVRIATKVRSPQWIRTEHANQVDPKMFFALGEERPVP